MGYGKRVILHIGTLKTGSTSLQAFLRRNTASLSAQGVGVYIPHISENRAISNAGFLCWDSFAEASNEMPKDPLHALEMEAFSAFAIKYDTLILSEEFMWEKGIEAPAFWDIVRKNIIKMLGADTQVDIVVFVRRQDDWVLSRWKEYLLNTFCRDVMDFPSYLQFAKEAGYMDYHKAVSVISHTFGKKHVIVLRYDRKSGRAVDTTRDFLKAAGISPGETINAIKLNWNPSISMRAAEAMLHIIRSDQNRKTSSRDLFRAAKLFSSMYPDKYNYYPMHKKEHAAFLADFDESNERLSLEFNDGKDLFIKEIDDYCYFSSDPKQAMDDAGMILKLASLPDNTKTFLQQTIRELRNK